MNPGRELDAIIAEKIMGWRFTGGFTTIPELGSDRWATDENGCERFYHEVPLYSTDIAAAWKVVEKINDPRFILTNDNWSSTASFADKDCEPGWYCCINDKYARGETPPHAICLAALRALEK